MLTGMQNFLGHSEGVSKVTSQICRDSGLGGQKNCFICWIWHYFGHHKSMQVWKPLSLAWYLLYMAGCLDKSCIWQWFVLLGLFLLCFAFWVHREVGCVGENGSQMHTLLIGQVWMVLLSHNRLFHGHGRSLFLPEPSRWRPAPIHGLPSQTS